MRLPQYAIAITAVIVNHLGFAASSPQLDFPVNSQVPPVAYTDQPYSFSFSPSTFHSQGSSLSYSISNGPAWLSLDSVTRTIQGTPTAADSGAPQFQLTATDDDGSTSSSVTLVVLQNAAITPGQPILQYLEAAGQLSAPDTLVLKPLVAFEIAFPPAIFSGLSPSTAYYATSSNSSPLPPWIQFESQDLTFSGTTPPLVSPRASQQTYGIRLSASNAIGFSEAEVSFQIAISYHTFAFASAQQDVNLTTGQLLNIPPILTDLQLDGAQILSTQLASVDSNAPSWLVLDAADISFRGTPPSDFKDANVSIRATDTFGDVANMTLILQSQTTDATSSQSQTLKATAIAGQQFSYKLNESIFDGSKHISVDFGNTSEWLSFSSENLTFHGTVPKSLLTQTTTLSLVAASGNIDERTSVVLRIEHLASAPSSTSSLAQSPTQTTTSQPSQTSNEIPPLPTGTHTNTKHLIIIILGTVVPLLVVCILIGICLWCLRRRSRRQEKGKATEESGDELHDVNVAVAMDVPPVPDTSDLPAVAESSRQASSRQMTPTQPPKIELPWAPDSLPKAKDRLSKNMKTKRGVSEASSWGGLVLPPSRGNTSEALPLVAGATGSEQVLRPASPPPPIPSYSARRQVSQRQPPAKRASSRTQRASKTLSVVVEPNTGLPNRLSGAGHGSGALIPNASVQRSSWQTTLGSIPLVEQEPSMEAFPPLPSDEKENLPPRTPRGRSTMKSSLRLVEPDSEPSASFELQRQRWHTERARDRLEGHSRFSNAGSSRTPSQSRIANQAQSPSRTISSAIPEHDTVGSRLSRPSWSKWSGVGPAARAESGFSAKTPAPLFSQAPSRLMRHVSMASSGQFDSALSSDSQWEDDNLVAELNEAGERQWHTDTESAAASPRLPFDTFSSSQEEVGRAKQVGVSRGAKLIDKRRHVSLEDAELKRSEKSQKGSFAFI